jgi:hypothetical protein
MVTVSVARTDVGCGCAWVGAAAERVSVDAAEGTACWPQPVSRAIAAAVVTSAAGPQRCAGHCLERSRLRRGTADR